MGHSCQVVMACKSKPLDFDAIHYGKPPEKKKPKKKKKKKKKNDNVMRLQLARREKHAYFGEDVS